MDLSIAAEWEALDAGPPAEQACFAAISIHAGKVSLTKAEDAYVNRLRSSVHLSAYHLAEWFAWNWWRQRWEPRTRAPDWDMAHRMTTIGGGYVWPNISIVSDGERIVVVAKPTGSRAAEPLRYLADIAAVFRAIEFEGAVSRFIEQVQGQLRAEHVEETNLDHAWADVDAERADPEAAKRRQLEALLGKDPDEADPSLLERLVTEAEALGEGAVREMAATSSGGGSVLSAADLQTIASRIGFATRPRDAVRLQSGVRLPPIGQVPAWLRGAQAAQFLRDQENLGAAPISNDRLAAMSGVDDAALSESASGSDLSFAIDDQGDAGHVVLRSKWETGRRFDLARLLGDRIAGSANGPLFPATRTYTYRQKLQRSFSAELLCPFEAVEDMLDGDYSEEKQEDVAGHFKVSPLTVRTLLTNHGRIDRNDFDWDYQTVTTA